MPAAKNRLDLLTDPAIAKESLHGRWDSVTRRYSALEVEKLCGSYRSDVHTRNQYEVGTGYFDQVAQVASIGLSSTQALAESTEAAQF